MAIRPVILFPDPVLLTPTRRVESIDAAVRELVEDMRETMYDAPGIGLAANQVGVSQRICLVDLTAGERPDNLHVFINPRILESSGSQKGEEGCLSFPDVTLEIERAEHVVVEAQGLDGELFRCEADGLMARAILHECEHLDGHVFLRNISPLKRELIKKQIRKRIEAGDWVAAEHR